MEQLLSMEFTGVVALTFLLYAIRRASKISNRYIPIVGIFLGIGFAAFEAKGFDFDSFMQGLKYALYAVGMVAGYKYSQEGRNLQSGSLLGGIKKAVQRFSGKNSSNNSNQNDSKNENKNNPNGTNPPSNSNDFPVNGEADI
ncbi:hypothetical protein SAMN05421676_10313 [Salinibacillus kushneri]|uniref:Holin n=1 Tax=Salinibacillus kushneri TaxID=237682 RepID=A0A1I0C3P0_9BACI|nr:phage holin family protein [Salinibacillus kushneri]SET13725.1 hypothetical protein SAMN05421676_10313 [Salinibacillus kushneri]